MRKERREGGREQNRAAKYPAHCPHEADEDLVTALLLADPLPLSSLPSVMLSSLGKFNHLFLHQEPFKLKRRRFQNLYFPL